MVIRHECSLAHGRSCARIIAMHTDGMIRLESSDGHVFDAYERHPDSADGIGGRGPGDLRGERAHPLGGRSIRRSGISRRRTGHLRQGRTRCRARLRRRRHRAGTNTGDGHRNGCGDDGRGHRGRLRSQHRAGRHRRLLLRRLAGVAGRRAAPGRRRSRLLREPDPRCPRFDTTGSHDAPFRRTGHGHPSRSCGDDRAGPP